MHPRRNWQIISSRKLFTADDANELIPTLEVLIRDLQDQARTLRERIQELARCRRLLRRFDAAARDRRTLSELRPNHHADGRDRGADRDPRMLSQGYRPGTGRFSVRDRTTKWSFCAGNSANRRSSRGIPIEGGFADRQPLPGARTSRTSIDRYLRIIANLSPTRGCWSSLSLRMVSRTFLLFARAWSAGSAGWSFSPRSSRQ